MTLGEWLRYRRMFGRAVSEAFDSGYKMSPAAWELTRARCKSAARSWSKRDSHVLVWIPRELLPQVEQLAYTANVERAAERWAGRIADVSLDDWQAAVRARPQNSSP